MITEITKAEINKEQVVLEGTNLETIFTAEDLYEDIPEETIRFVFDRSENHGAGIKYLYKVCTSQRKCQNAKSLGEKIENLVGCIISLSESFIEKA